MRNGPPTHFMRALKLQAGSGLNGDDAAGGPAAAAASLSTGGQSSGDEAADTDGAEDGADRIRTRDTPCAGRRGGNGRPGSKAPGGRCLLPASPSVPFPLALLPARDHESVLPAPQATSHHSYRIHSYRLHDLHCSPAAAGP